MRKYLKSGLISLVSVLTIVVFVFAGITNVDDLQLDGNDLLDSSGVARVTVGTTNTITGNATVTGNLAVSGTATSTGIVTITTGSVTGLFGLRSASDPNTSVIPDAAGQIMFDSSTGDVCVSTAGAVNSWVLISTPTVKCAS